jgi:hypothetical protein
MDSVIKHILNVGLGKIKTNNKGEELKSIIINDKTYRYDKDKPLTKILKHTISNIETSNKYRASKLLNKASDKNKVRMSLRKYAIAQKATITDEQSAFKNYVNSFSISNINLKGLKGLSYLRYQEDRLKQFLNKNTGMKILIHVEALTDEGDTVKFKSRRFEVLNTEDIIDAMTKVANDIETQIEVSQLSKSNIIIEKINKITVNYDKYNPTRAGSYIELPKWISLKKACINIKNEDHKCFKYCVQCSVFKIYEKDNPNRMIHYKNLKDNIINWECMKYPCSRTDINRFEELNSGLIAVNVYKLFNETIITDRISKVKNAKHHIHLLMIEGANNKYHYVLIKDLSRLISNQYNKHNEKKQICPHCLRGFQSKDTLIKHIDRGCLAVEGQQIQMPKEGEQICFKNHSRKFKAPFVMYADFECLTSEYRPSMSKPIDPNKSYTEKYQHHKPCGYKINVVNSITNETESYLYRGQDCMQHFVKTCRDIRIKIMEKLKVNVPIIMTEEDEYNFKNATHCGICDNELNNDKVRDHCHMTGKYRCCAHSECNLHFNHKDFKIPIFFHNLKGYDSHFIICNAHEFNSKKKIDVIAQNSEKFIMFGFDNLQFKDSFSFLSSSLDRLVGLSKYKDYDDIRSGKIAWKDREYLDNWKDNFKHSRNSPYVSNDEDLDMLTDKGVYPYDYMNNWERFNDTELPKKEDFYSKLYDEHISNDEYERAKHVWNRFKIKDMGEYHDLYLRSDVLLLTDIFENFRNLCMKYYGLDPAYYMTLPNFAWDAMLKKTNITLDLVHDQDMYEMIEKGKRGGVCQVSSKYAKANNKYMKSYNQNIISSYLTYLDANNLYGLAMCMKLPYGQLHWSNDIKTTDDVMKYEDNDVGYFLEVDLHYPKHLHDYHKDYPLAPQIMSVSENMVSDVSKEIYKQYHNGKDVKDEKTSKLLLTLYDKEKYVIHIRNLKYYLEKGLELKRIHRCIKFSQSAWLKKWIDFNTEKRKEATNDFDKDLFKLMNNAVYGKTMEDVRGHVDFELVDTPQRMEKVLNAPTLKHRHILNENLVGVEKTKPLMKLNKPIYIGVSILELSKLHMYQYHYDVMKKNYDDKIKLLYTDTDSFIYHIETEDLYKDFDDIKEHMDFSGYDKSHPSYDCTNKKVLGKFKDEHDGNIFTQFIGLKPKMYCTETDDRKTLKKGKGIDRKVVKSLSTDDYLYTLTDNKKSLYTSNKICSKNHQVFSITQNKVGLSNYDNKRYYTDNITSVPYGYHLIN